MGLTGTGAAVAPTTSRRPVLLAVGVLLAFFVILTDASGTILLQPTIADALDVPTSSAALVYAAYFVAYAVPLLVAGRLGDLVGPRVVLLVSMAVFLVATAGSALAPSLEFLVASRTLQGLAGGAATPQLLSILKLQVPERLRGAVMTANGIVVVLAFFLGPSLSGLATAVLGWRSFYALLVVLGLASLPLIFSTAVAAHGPRRAPIDHTSAALACLAPACLATGLVLVRADLPAGVPGSVVAAGAALTAWFVLRQPALPEDSAVAPASLFAVPAFRAACLTTLQLGFSTTVMMAAVMGYLQLERGLSPLASGLVLTPMAAVALLLAPWVSGHTSRGKEWVLVALGFAIFTVAMGALSWVGDATTPLGVILALSAASGAACACVFGPLSALAMRDADARHSGAASGVYNFTRQFGGALGAGSLVALGGSRVESLVASALPAGAHAVALVLSAAVMATGTLTAAHASRAARTADGRAVQT